MFRILLLRCIGAGLVLCLCSTASSGDMPSAGWSAKWIAYPYKMALNSFDYPVYPMPIFRRDFTLDADVSNAVLRVSGLGFFSCSMDGQRISDARLVPAPAQYDRRWRYRTFRLGTIKAGTHVISATVGDGFYRTGNKVFWLFQHAPWTDYPKFSAELREEGASTALLTTDESWQTRFSPIVRSDFRGGETYDARQEAACDPLGGEGWLNARLVPGPGGLPEEETFPPCRTLTAHPMTRLAGTDDWMSPVNIAGIPRLRVRGEPGAQMTLVCGERGKDKRTGAFRVRYGENQTDVYILRGGEVETWMPEFTYHGFDCIRVAVKGKAEVLSLDAVEVHTDFRRIGGICTSDKTLMRVHDAAMQSALNNFVGIPTDCPHREKNGWTSEARLMFETLAYAWDVSGAYLAYADEIVDAQRPSGQIPGMLPTGGVGYNWGSGPAWDAALACIPDGVARFTGDASVFERYRESIVRYCRFAETLLDADGLCTFGLGDWCSCGKEVPTPYVTSAFYVRCLDLIDDPKTERARQAILEKYYLGNGRFTVESSVMPALALEHRLVPASERMACEKELARIVSQNKGRVDFGTIGSGCVLRALFEAGMADLGYLMMTQPEPLGYAAIVGVYGATTFAEDWKVPESSSRNHGAFCDVAACMYRYLGGLRFDSRTGELTIRPLFPHALQDFAAEHRGVSVAWRRSGNDIVVEIVVSKPVPQANYVAPDGRVTRLSVGRHRFRHRQ